MSEIFKSKRKAISPCLSSKVKAKIIVKDQTQSAQFVQVEMSSTQPEELTKDITYRILTKDGEEFLGALTRPQAYKLWKACLYQTLGSIFGIGLIQVRDRPFCVVYRLNEPIELSKATKAFECEIENVGKLTGELLLSRPPPPKLGEEIELTIKGTRFKLEPHQVDAWVGLFGAIVLKAAFAYDEQCPGICSDDIVVTAKLRKHLPGILPAFGRRMMVRYAGQPLQCNKCFDVGHLRRKCPAKESVEWAAYVKWTVKEILKESNVSLIGQWADLFK